MSDAPERIWIDAAGGRWSPVSGGTQGVEYVRADALPAVQVTVKPLEWVDFADRGAKAQAWNYANYTLQKWSDGRWELGASYSGYTTSIYGIDRFYPTIEAAKAAAQADYEARIRSAMTVTPAPDAPELAALVDAAKNAIVSMQEARATIVSKREHAVLTDAVVSLRAALAAIKEPKT